MAYYKIEQGKTVYSASTFGEALAVFKRINRKYGKVRIYEIDNFTGERKLVREK